MYMCTCIISLGHPGTVWDIPGQFVAIPDIIPESLPECLIIVVIGRADARYHDGLSVPSQRRLQQTCQFRVPVWNVSGAAVHQRCGNDVMIVKVKGLTYIYLYNIS